MTAASGLTADAGRLTTGGAAKGETATSVDASVLGAGAATLRALRRPAIEELREL